MKRFCLRGYLLLSWCFAVFSLTSRYNRLDSRRVKTNIISSSPSSILNSRSGQSVALFLSVSPRVQRLKDVALQKDVLRAITAAEFALKVEAGGRKDDIIDFDRLIDGLNAGLIQLKSRSSPLPETEKLSSRINSLRNELLQAMQRQPATVEATVAIPSAPKSVGGARPSDAVRTNDVMAIIGNETDSKLRVKDLQDSLRILIREDGSVDWDGAIASGKEVAKFGAELWERLNGKDKEEGLPSVAEVFGQLQASSPTSPEIERLARITAAAAESVKEAELQRDQLQQALRRARRGDRDGSMQSVLAGKDEGSGSDGGDSKASWGRAGSGGGGGSALSTSTGMSGARGSIKRSEVQSLRKLDQRVKELRKRLQLLTVHLDLERVCMFLQQELEAPGLLQQVPEIQAMEQRTLVAQVTLIDKQLASVLSEVELGIEALYFDNSKGLGVGVGVEAGSEIGGTATSDMRYTGNHGRLNNSEDLVPDLITAAALNPSAVAAAAVEIIDSVQSSTGSATTVISATTGSDTGAAVAADTEVGHHFGDRLTDLMALIDGDELNLIQAEVNDLKNRLGLDTQLIPVLDWGSLGKVSKEAFNKIKVGLTYFGEGTNVLVADLQYAWTMLLKAAQGYTLKPREVNTIRRTGKDLLTLIPFTIILIVPLTPVGHVLVFAFIQKYFPEFYPSCYTEKRLNLKRLFAEVERRSDEELLLGKETTSESIMFFSQPLQRMFASWTSPDLWSQAARKILSVPGSTATTTVGDATHTTPTASSSSSSYSSSFASVDGDTCSSSVEDSAVSKGQG